MRSVDFEVDVDGKFKVEKLISNETEAVEAIEDVKRAFQGLEYGPTTGYEVRTTFEDGRCNKSSGIACTEQEGAHAVAEMAIDLLKVMVYSRLIDLAAYPLLKAGYSFKLDLLARRDQLPAGGCTNCGAYGGEPQHTLREHLSWDGSAWVCDDCFHTVAEG